MRIEKFSYVNKYFIFNHIFPSHSKSLFPIPEAPPFTTRNTSRNNQKLKIQIKIRCKKASEELMVWGRAFGVSFCVSVGFNEIFSFHKYLIIEK